MAKCQFLFGIKYSSIYVWVYMIQKISIPYQAFHPSHQHFLTLYQASEHSLERKVKIIKA